MLSLEECLGFCDLAEDEVATIAEHEQVSMIIATGIGNELLKTPRGVYRLHNIFRESLERAVEKRQFDKAKLIDSSYRRFMAAHPMPRVLR